MCMCMLHHQVVSMSFSTPWTVSLPRFSVYGISQARILEWIAISFSRDLSDPGIELTLPVSPELTGQFFTTGPLFYIRIWNILYT